MRLASFIYLQFFHLLIALFFRRSSSLRDILLLLLLSYFAFGWNLGKLGLIDPDEPFYALTGRAMVQSGDWLTPQIFGAPQFEKPIFYYWMLSGSYRIFGESEWAGRLPTALSATALVLLTYAFARRVFNARAGLLAGIFMTGGLELALMGRLMLTDIPLAVFITAALYCYWLALEKPERRDRWIFGYMVFTGLAVLTKGPIGTLVPLFATLSFTILGKRPWVLRGRGFWLGLAAHLAIVLPWYTLMTVEYGWKFVDEFFYRDNYLRFIRAEHPSNNHFWYYPGVLLLGSIPWLPAALLAFRRLFTGWRSTPAMLFVACWFVPNLLFLTAAQSKLPSYGFYLFVPLAFLIGTALDRVLSNGFEGRGEKGMVIGAAALQALALGGALLVEAARPFAVPAAAFGAVLLFALAALCLGRLRLWLGATTVSTAVFIFCAMTFSFDAMENMVSIRPIAKKMMAMQTEGEHLLAGKFGIRGVVYYTHQTVAVMSRRPHPFWADHPVEVVVGLKGLSKLLADHPTALCTLRKADWNTFKKSAAFGPRNPGEWFGESLLIRAHQAALPQAASPAATTGN